MQIPGQTGTPEKSCTVWVSTITLITFLRVADDRIQPPYLNSTRNEGDFCNIVRQLKSEDADKNYTIICNDLNTPSL